jgi:hypothetical protein
VYTHLERESQPMLRLWSGDLSRYTTEPCACVRAGSLELTGFKSRRISDRRDLSEELKACRKPRRGRRPELATAPWRWAGLLGDRGGDNTEHQASVVQRREL